MAALIACTAGLLWVDAMPAAATSAKRAESVVTGRDAAAVKGRVAAAYGRSPLAFEPNRGQAAAGVRYLAHGAGYGVFLTGSRTVVTLAPRSKTEVGGRPHTGPAGRWNAEHPDRRAGAMLSFRAVGGNTNPVVVGGSRLAGRVNYLRGRDRAGWRTDIPTFGDVTERGVYPGVDLRWYGTRRGLEYDVAVAPGADPGQVRLAIDGLRGRPRLTGRGDLVMPTAVGDVLQRAPRAYQIIDGRSRPVAARFTLAGGEGVGFTVAAHDQRRPLVIDPGLVYSTYLGGTGFDESIGIALDSSGNAYVTGDTASTNFPISRAVQPRSGGGTDAFVTKLDSTGTGLVYSTYLGGSGDDDGVGIAVDSSGNAYVTGDTDSTNFPTTAGAFQTTSGGGVDEAFVTKLDRTGGALAYSSYLGGSDYDQGDAVVVDSSGNAYVSGLTYSDDFPTTTGAFQRTLAGRADAFVTKVNPAGSGLVYSTYLGGDLFDEGVGIAVDSSGNAYVGGETSSDDFPTTAGAFQRTLTGALNAFVTKVDPTGTGLVYSTYLGGSASDIVYGIAVNASGNAYLAGATDSTDFPHTTGAFQTAFAGGDLDGFVTELNPAGTGLVYSTYLGGSGDDDGVGIAVDSSGNAYVTGDTDSTNFPTSRAVQPRPGGRTDAFVTKLNPAGTGLVYSTYLGGTGYDGGMAIAVDPSGNAYLTGVTDSRNFPTTAGAFQTRYGGGGADAFVTKIGIVAPPQAPAPSEAKPGALPGHSADSAVAGHTDDTAVAGNVNSHGHHSIVNSSRSRHHAGHRHWHRWRHRHG
ncbi:SBBP repeat-containing protein [Actinoallomurus iriomotensis]|uniref:SBBP repeat-containing protein n=1 Tax=Actinoallomurus iriomotensis TaxID=478107 RepID=UPI002557A156|nr:SBBP repeat-containing protein [Actinoallomurus iriomotensis]